MKTILLLIFIALPFKVFAKDLNIITSIKPIYSIINGIIGKYNHNHLLIEKHQSIHDYNLKPSDLHKINNSDIIFLINFDFEFYMKKLLNNIDSKTEIIELSSISNLNILPIREYTIFSDNAHHDHNHGFQDYHLWLDIDNVSIIVQYILDVICQKDPDNKSYYQQNAKIILNKLKEVDHRLKVKLSAYSKIPYLVSHDAYQYFEKKYNLNALSAISISPEGSLSLKKIAELQKIISDHKIKCIFLEPNYPQAVISKLAKLTETNLGNLDAEWGSDKLDMDGYIELMENLGDNLANCLSISNSN